jgi:hypothetical protein
MTTLHEEALSTEVISLGILSNVNYKLIETNAPVEYDYAYVIPCFKYDDMRLVLIPEESVAYQCGRYASGMKVGQDVTGNPDLMELALRDLRKRVLQ